MRVITVCMIHSSLEYLLESVLESGNLSMIAETPGPSCLRESNQD